MASGMARRSDHPSAVKAELGLRYLNPVPLHGFPTPSTAFLEALGCNLYHDHFEIISNIIGDANVIGPSPSGISVQTLSG
jgi:hypothetical protein